MNIEKQELKMTVASNNVTPQKFETYNRIGLLDNWKDIPGLTDREKFIFPIIIDVFGGMLKLNSSVSTKIKYAFIETNGYIKYLERNKQINFFDISYHCNAIKYTEEIKNIVEEFEKAYKRNDEKIAAYIVIDDSKYLVKVTKYGFKYVTSKHQGRKFYSLKNIEIENRKLSDMGFETKIVQ